MRRPDEVKAERRRRTLLPTWAAVTIGLLGVGVTALAVLFFVVRADSRDRIADMQRRLGELCAADDARPACQKLPPNVVVQVSPSPSGSTVTTAVLPATVPTTVRPTTATTARPTTTTSRAPSPQPPSSTTSTTGPPTTTSTTAGPPIVCVLGRCGP